MTRHPVHKAPARATALRRLADWLRPARGNGQAGARTGQAGGKQRFHLAVTPGRYASRGWRTKSPSPGLLTIMPSPFSISSARAATRCETW